MSDRELELAMEDCRLDDLGLLDEGEPTRWGHWLYRREMLGRLQAGFTPAERARIRLTLGMGEG